jgi:hypothetical protein
LYRKEFLMMKFLESFDLFGGEYKKITRGQFNDTTKGKKIPELNETLRKKIESIFQKVLNPYNIKQDWPKVEKWHTQSTNFYCDYTAQLRIFIYIYEDEWYYLEKYRVESSSTYYECDGLDGMEKCLKDKF